MTSPERGVDAARYDAAREWIIEYKATTGFGWAKIGREVGDYSEATMSLLASGRYPRENAANLVAAVEAFARLVDARRRSMIKPGFVLTSIAKRINALIWRTQLHGRIGLVTGDSGIGKTEAMKNHAAGVPNAAYVLLNSNVRSSCALLRKMLAAIDRAPRQWAPHILYDRLVEHTRGTSWYYLIDEAHSLRPEALDTIRCFQEEAGIAVVLGGNAELYQNAQWAREGSASLFTQFQSRCAVREHLTATHLKRTDVVAIAQQIIGLDLTEACADVLLAHSRVASKGALRTMVTVLQDAYADRKEDTGTITKNEIASAIERHSRKASSAA